MEEKIKIYTDGSCEPNGYFPNKGAWAFTVQMPNGTENDLGAGKAKDTSNNRMEMIAVINAIRWCIGSGKSECTEAIIYSDSGYVVNGFNRWMHNWYGKTVMKEIKNKDLWDILYSYKDAPISLQWVKGHNGNPGNERANQLAEKFRKI